MNHAVNTFVLLFCHTLKFCDLGFTLNARAGFVKNVNIKHKLCNFSAATVM